jgi:oligopeptide transport system ATP-binding protein
MSGAGPLVEVRDLKKHFPVKRGLVFDRVIGQIKAVDGVSFAIRRGETFGLVGESGCGKTTIGRLLLKLDHPTAGEIRFDGEDIAGFDARQTLAFRRRVQAVFQDPYSSLNPRMTVEEIVGEPLLVHGVESDRAARLQRVRGLLSVCGLPARSVDRYPHEMSGGQRQRVGIARALALRPDFIVCDEAVSALDVSIQAQIMQLLTDLQARLGLSYLFIAHDLAVVGQMSDRVAVMYLGKIVELADRDSLYSRAHHPYTQALFSAVPIPDPAFNRVPSRSAARGEVPSSLAPPPGCRFHTRCPLAQDVCRTEEPRLEPVAAGHLAACHFAEEAMQASPVASLVSATPDA